MTRLRGRALRGARVHAKAPHGHWQTTTMICSIWRDGSTACMTLNGATDTEAFRTFVRCVLGPRLRPGDVLIMDNLLAPQKPTHAQAHSRGRSQRAFPSAVLA